MTYGDLGPVGLRVEHAKGLARRVQARGVIVLAFGPETFTLASYGESKHECRQLTRLSDQIADKLVSGEWGPWQAGVEHTVSEP